MDFKGAQQISYGENKWQNIRMVDYDTEIELSLTSYIPSIFQYYGKNRENIIFLMFMDYEQVNNHTLSNFFLNYCTLI